MLFRSTPPGVQFFGALLIQWGWQSTAKANLNRRGTLLCVRQCWANVENAKMDHSIELNASLPKCFGWVRRSREISISTQLNKLTKWLTSNLHGELRLVSCHFDLSRMSWRGTHLFDLFALLSGDFVVNCVVWFVWSLPPWRGAICSFLPASQNWFFVVEGNVHLGCKRFSICLTTSVSARSVMLWGLPSKSFHFLPIFGGLLYN